MLTSEQQASFQRDGYLLLERLVDAEWLGRLNDVTDEMVERSRSLTSSDDVFDLEPGHTRDAPRLRRLSSPVVHHALYWEFISNSVVTDVAADLIGPGVKFHHSKLNFKWERGGQEVKWHQDIQFFPHTNYDVLTIGVYLHDCEPDQGPLRVLRGSHNGELYNLYDDAQTWTGALSDSDAARLDLSQSVDLPGPAGSVTVHHCRTVHGSAPNDAASGRPLLLATYTAADAMPYTPNGLATTYYGALVRGEPARWARHDPRPCLLPPDWSGGYTSIFDLQKDTM